MLEELLECRGGNRGAEEISLDAVTSEGAQVVELVVGVDTFSDDGEVEAMGESDDTFGDSGVVGVIVEVLDEGLVDFEDLDGEAFEVEQGGVASAKVIDGDVDAHLVEDAHLFARVFFVLHEDIFGDFEFEVLGVEAGFVEDFGDKVDEVGALKLPGREVDGDTQRREASVLPGFVLAACFAQDPLAHSDDHAAGFGDRDKATGGYQAELWVLPAQEGLGADDAVAGGGGTGLGVRFVDDGDLWLVVEDELLALKGPPQVIFEGEALKGRDVHGGGMEVEGVFAPFFGLVHGVVSVLEEALWGGAIERKEADADAGGQKDLMALQRKGLFHGGEDGLYDAYGHLGLFEGGQEQSELVATEARDGIIFAGALLESLCDGAQKAVAVIVSEGVVDALKAVQVEVEDGEHLFLLSGPEDGSLEAVSKEDAIGESSQGVLLGEVLQTFDTRAHRLFVLFACGDIVGCGLDADGLAICIDERAQGDLKPQVIASLVSDTHAQLEGIASESLRKRPLQGLSIGLQRQEFLQLLLQELRGSVAEQLYAGGVDVLKASRGRVEGDQLRGLLDQQAKELRVVGQEGSGVIHRQKEKQDLGVVFIGEL